MQNTKQDKFKFGDLVTIGPHTQYQFVFKGFAVYPPRPKRKHPGYQKAYFIQSIKNEYAALGIPRGVVYVPLSLVRRFPQP